MSSPRGESRVPGAAGFIGKLAVFHLLPAGACMHAPGTPGRNDDGEAWTRYHADMDPTRTCLVCFMRFECPLYQHMRVISNALFNNNGTEYRLLKFTVV